MANFTEIEGEWRLIRHWRQGRLLDEQEITPSARLIVQGNGYKVVCNDRVYVDVYFRLNPEEFPKEIDLLQLPDSVRPLEGIYEFSGDKLTIQTAIGYRPSHFQPGAIDSGFSVYLRCCEIR